MKLSQSQYLWIVLIIGFLGALLVIKEIQNRDPEFKKRKALQYQVPVTQIDTTTETTIAADPYLCQSQKSRKSLELLIHIFNNIGQAIEQNDSSFIQSSYSIYKQEIDSLSTILQDDLDSASLTKRYIGYLKSMNKASEKMAPHYALSNEVIIKLKKLLLYCEQQ